MSRLMDGRQAAEEMLGRVRAHAAGLTRDGVKPGLATVLVGEDPASQVYVKSKSRRAQECGFHSVQHTLPAGTPQDELLALVHSLNEDPAIHGILVQLPLPGPIDADRIVQAIAPDKDVDGFHFLNVGKLSAGALGAGTFVPCTPAGVMVLLRQVRGPDLSGLHAVVIGRSNIVGKPVASLLLAANATVTLAHSRTTDLRAVVRSADIVVAAVGRANLVKGDWIKPGATVIDVGINRIDEAGGRSRLVGDVDFAQAREVAQAITPVPGGVGPMTIAMLMVNTLNSACRAAGYPPLDLA